jgi:hypothetical protein
MEPPPTGQEAIGHDESPVHTWRVSRLERLGVPGPLAEIYADCADCIDWHQIAQLVHHAEVISLKGYSYWLKNRDLGRIPTASHDHGETP